MNDFLQNFDVVFLTKENKVNNFKTMPTCDAKDPELPKYQTCYPILLNRRYVIGAVS